MIHRTYRPFALRASLAAIAATVLVALACRPASAQISTIGNINRVGGISIDTSGLISNAEKSARIALRDELRKLHKPAPASLKEASELRLVSLKQLEHAARESGVKTAEDLPDDLRFLAGLQRIQYVLVYPETNDIVLAGPGEGWKVGDDGSVIGETTGRPVLLLEDLLVALRTVDIARQGGISCSIDPTAEGRQRLDALLAQPNTYSSRLLDAIRRALGKQTITITGVPAQSHLARVLVSSDYHMKRIAMKLENAPLRELPSFIDMLKHENAALENMMPRWWLEYARQPLGRSEDGLAFELPAKRVKCLTEDEVVDGAGKVRGTGAANPVAQKWADAMTAHYDELTLKEPVFGELGNVMDMCVVAALLMKERLVEKAGCELPTLSSSSSPLAVHSYHAPKQVETLCSAVKRGSDYIVTASGGVQIASWHALEDMQSRPAISQVRQRAKPRAGQNAWWNAE